MTRPIGRRTALIAIAVLAAAVAVPASAQLLSKRYEFKEGVILQIGTLAGEGLRLDSVRFELPPPVKGKVSRVAGRTTAEVAISNTDEEPRRVGIAIALFDDKERLVGVASGGTGLKAIRAERQRAFDLVFEDVNTEVTRATTFQITVETRP